MKTRPTIACHVIARHRGREQVSLTEFTAESTQSVELHFVLDAFGEHGHVEFLAQRDDRLEQVSLRVDLVDRTNEGLVDLDDSRTEGREIGQRRETGAEIVQGDPDAQRAQEVHHGHRLGDVDESNTLGDLQDEEAGGSAHSRNRLLIVGTRPGSRN